jgi:glycosyltransferase involved in cell wall biosynthesis
MTILFPTPVVYDGNDARYLRRDGARFVTALNASGGRGTKIILSSAPEAPQPTSPDLRAGTFAEWRDPAFWSSFEADGALCYFGFAPRRFLPVVRAMRAAGLRLALKADSAFGLPRFPWHAATLFRTRYWYARERMKPPAAAFRATLGLARWALGRNPSDFIPFFESFDSITTESPLSRDTTRAWLLRHGRPDLADRVIVLPHPVPDEFAFDPVRDVKENRVLAIAADWSNPRKGGAVLAGALERFLAARPDWSATVVGARSNLVADAAPRVRDRIDARPSLEASEILPLYRSSRIFAITSGSEGAPNVVFESLACGCSVVFPPELLQLSWIAEAGLGTMSRARTPAAFAAALESDRLEWERAPAREPRSPLPPLHASEILRNLLSSCGWNGQSRQ